MKRYLFIVCILLLNVCAYAFTRLTPETHHFVAVHGDLGYSALLHTIPGQRAAAGVNANIGLDYRLYRNNFLLSIGAEGMYEMNSNHLKSVDMSVKMIDTEGDIFNMHVMMDKSRDRSHMVNLNIPLLVGGEWRRVYFLIGPKVSLNLYGSTSSQAQYTTFGEYERYYDDFYDMPNHQFESGRKMNSGNISMKWNFNILAHAEVGARIGHMYKYQIFHLNPDMIRMYLAVYADFGVLNLHSATKTDVGTFGYKETDQGVQFYVQPLMLSNLAADAVFRNLNVGVKFTVAFEMKQNTKSYIYDYDRVERNYRRRGGNQAIKH